MRGSIFCKYAASLWISLITKAEDTSAGIRDQGRRKRMKEEGPRETNSGQAIGSVTVINPPPSGWLSA